MVRPTDEVFHADYIGTVQTYVLMCTLNCIEVTYYTPRDIVDGDVVSEVLLDIHFIHMAMGDIHCRDAYQNGILNESESYLLVRVRDYLRVKELVAHTPKIWTDP